MNDEFESISIPKELLENLVRQILADYISLYTTKPEKIKEPNGFEYEPITVSRDYVKRIRDFLSEQDDCPDADELLAETRWWLD